MDELIKELLNGNTTPVVAIGLGVAIMWKKFIRVEVGLGALKEKVEDIKVNCGRCRFQKKQES